MNGGTAMSVLAALFLAAVVLRLIPWRRLFPAQGSREALRAARTKIRAAATPSATASALEEAAQVATAAGLRRRALGYLRRALRADPTCLSALDRYAALCLKARQPRRLEQELWRWMAREQPDALRQRALEHLATLYEGPLHLPARAKALRGLEVPPGPRGDGPAGDGVRSVGATR